MRKVKIEINMDNAAFEDIYELPRLLGNVADRISDGEYGMDFPIKDINGNKVGYVKFEDEE